MNNTSVRYWPMINKTARFETVHFHSTVYIQRAIALKPCLKSGKQFKDTHLYYSFFSKTALPHNPIQLRDYQ